MTIRGAGLLPLGLMVLSASIGYAQSTVGAVEDAVAPAPAPPPPPARPAEMPPKPPTVACQGDTLTISADNSTLESILALVRGCTGAMEFPKGPEDSRLRTVRAWTSEGIGRLLSGTQENT
jgi:hypothetical protein